MLFDYIHFFVYMVGIDEPNLGLLFTSFISTKVLILRQLVWYFNNCCWL